MIGPGSDKNFVLLALVKFKHSSGKQFDHCSERNRCMLPSQSSTVYYKLIQDKSSLHTSWTLGTQMWKWTLWWQIIHKLTEIWQISSWKGTEIHSSSQLSVILLRSCLWSTWFFCCWSGEGYTKSCLVIYRPSRFQIIYNITYMTFVMVIQMSFMMELVNKTWRHLNVSMTLLRKTKKR